MNSLSKISALLLMSLFVFCISSNVSFAQQESSCKLFVPNIFSPNDDGSNDIFKPSSNCVVSEYQLKIFSRWGRLVFESKRLEDGWDGKVKGSTLPADVYVYFIQYTFEETEGELEKEILKGDVTLIR